jgi:hypothetical protein
MKTYTFHISLPGYGRVWRKVEIPADYTLQELHWAIQEVFNFDDDHLYSFFMSGKPWDRKTEYSLPEGADPWGLFPDGDEDEDEAESAEDQELPSMDELIDPDEAAAMQLSLGEMFGRLGTDQEFRDQVKEGMTKDLGLPEFVVDMLLSRASEMASMMPEATLDDIFSVEGEDGLAGDVRSTTLESLNLKVGKRFLYLFDYGDEWRFDVKVHAVQEDADPDAEYPRLVGMAGEAPRQYPDWEDDEDWEEDDEDVEDVEDVEDEED